MKGKFILAGALAIAAISANAQSNDYKTRIGHGQDSIDVIAAIQEYQETFKAKDYDATYQPWKTVITKAPTARVKTYKDGQTLLQNLIKKETDATKKQQYFNDLMNLYDTRLKYMETLNSFAGPKDQSSKGGILCRKAYDSYFFNPNPDVEKSYQMFKEGINDTGKDTEGFVLYGFIQLSDNRFENDKENAQKREDFINDYTQVTDICNTLLEQANDYPTSTEIDSLGDTITVLDPRAQKIIDNYQIPADQANELFVTSGVADCDALAKIYGPQIEANKTNEKFLIAVLKTLRNSDCNNSDAYAKASDYAYALHPTSESAMGKAAKCLKAGQSSEAIKYLNEAYAQESNPAKKSKLVYTIAALLYKSGRTSECMSWINKAPNNGQLQLLKASIVARSGNTKSIAGTYPYCLAIDICNRAKAADPSCAGKANRQIASYTNCLYPKSEAFFDTSAPKAGARVSCSYGSTTLRYR